MNRRAPRTDFKVCNRDAATVRITRVLVIFLLITCSCDPFRDVRAIFTLLSKLYLCRWLILLSDLSFLTQHADRHLCFQRLEVDLWSEAHVTLSRGWNSLVRFYICSWQLVVFFFFYFLQLWRAVGWLEEHFHHRANGLFLAHLGIISLSQRIKFRLCALLRLRHSSFSITSENFRFQSSKCLRLGVVYVYVWWCTLMTFASPGM